MLDLLLESFPGLSMTIEVVEYLETGRINGKPRTQLPNCPVEFA